MTTSTRASVRHERIGPEQAGRRLDNVLLSLLKGAPKSLIYKLLRSGQVRVNGGRAKPDYRLAEGDDLRLPPLERPARETGEIPSSRLAQLRSSTCYEDDRFIIIDKPSGLACHAGSGQAYGVIEIMRALRPEIERLDLGHRLDRETSGCLVLSKSLDALQVFHAALRARDSEKIYLALVRGQPPAELTRIDAAIDITREAHGERRAAVSDEGRTASTVIVARETHGKHSLLTLRLETGRMHQIRAHARHIGHPVAGDRDYGAAEFNRALRKNGLKRLFLHATQLSFRDGARTIGATVPLPGTLAQVLDRIAE